MSNTISDSLSRINLISSSLNRGFTMTFDNRVTVSVRWGTANYSDGKTTAEVAAWNTDTHEWVHVPGFASIDVIGHLTSDQIAEFMFAASKMKF